jgi:GlpG protein
MRQIGTLATSESAQKFAAYLVTQKIAAHAEQDNGEWAIWVKNEDQVAAARQSLEEFRAAPDDARFQGVQARAAEIQRQEIARRDATRKNIVEMRGRWQTAGGGVRFRQAPLTFVIIGLTLFVAYLTQLDTQRTHPAHEYLNFCRIVDDSQRGLWSVPRDSRGELDGFQQIRNGEVWRLVTPIFIHYGLLHLVFNMIWFFDFGRTIERRYGTWRLGLLILVVAMVSNILQYLWEGNPRFGGMSGVNYGLFGFIWMKSLFDARSGLHISQQTVTILMVWLFLCMAAGMQQFQWLPLGMIANVANTAHFVGLATGMGLAFVPRLFDG